MDKGRAQINGPKDQKIDGYSPSLKPGKGQRQIIRVKKEEEVEESQALTIG